MGTSGRPQELDNAITISINISYKDFDEIERIRKKYDISRSHAVRILVSSLDGNKEALIRENIELKRELKKLEERKIRLEAKQQVVKVKRPSKKELWKKEKILYLQGLYTSLSTRKKYPIKSDHDFLTIPIVMDIQNKLKLSSSELLEEIKSP